MMTLFELLITIFAKVFGIVYRWLHDYLVINIERVSSNSDMDTIRKKIENNPLMLVTKDNRDIGVITVSDMVKALRLM